MMLMLATKTAKAKAETTMVTTETLVVAVVTMTMSMVAVMAGAVLHSLWNGSKNVMNNITDGSVGWDSSSIDNNVAEST